MKREAEYSKLSKTDVLGEHIPEFEDAILALYTQEEVGALIYKADQWLRNNTPSDEDMTLWLECAVTDGDTQEDCIENSEDPTFILDALFEFMKTVVNMNDGKEE